MDEFKIRHYREYNRSNTPFAREMRKNPTSAEDKMWQVILKHRPGGYKFTRQKPMGSFILDFYCSRLSLAIEVDGEIHKKNKAYDRERTCFLSSKGISVMRYWNSEVMNKIDEVNKDLLNYIQELDKQPLSL